MDWLLAAALIALSIPLGRIATSTPMWRAAPKVAVTAAAALALWVGLVGTLAVVDARPVLVGAAAVATVGAVGWAVLRATVWRTNAPGRLRLVPTAPLADADHAVQAPRSRAALTDGVVERAAATVSGLTRAALDELSGGEPADHAEWRTHTDRIASAATACALFGIEPRDPDRARFHDLHRTLAIHGTKRSRHAGLTSSRPEVLMAASHDGRAAEAVVAETLRLAQSEYVLRRATGPFDIEGQRVPAGWMLRICVREAHLDPDHWPDPARFDPCRFATNPDARLYAPFGLDNHRCLGHRLTMSVAARFVASLARGYELVAHSVGTDRHSRFHWQPGPDFSVGVRPRLAADAEPPPSPRWRR